MTALRIIALWFLVAAPLAVLVGTVLRRRYAATTACPGCAARDSHIAGLKRANDAFYRANAALGVKVGRIEQSNRRERKLPAAGGATAIARNEGYS